MCGTPALYPALCLTDAGVTEEGCAVREELQNRTSEHKKNKTSSYMGAMKWEPIRQQSLESIKVGKEPQCITNLVLFSSQKKFFFLNKRSHLPFWAR